MVETGLARLAAHLRKNFGDMPSGPAELLGLIDFIATIASAGVTNSKVEAKLMLNGVIAGKILLSTTKAFLNCAEKVSVFSESRTKGPSGVSSVGLEYLTKRAF